MNRTCLGIGLFLCMMSAACGGKPPVVTPDPPIPICNGRDVVIYTLDASGRPLEGVTIRSSEAGNNRVSDGAGFSHRWACDSAVYTFELAGWHTSNCGEPGAACDLGGPEHRIHFARDALPEPEPPPPGVNIDPVQGAIWSDGTGFGDDTGYRTFTIIHAGDLPLRWHAGCQEECLADLDEMARAGYHIVRSWSHIRPGGWPWNSGGSPPYDGLDARSPGFVEREAALLTAVAQRGMRMTLETGGIDGINTEQEREVMRQLRRAADLAGHWTVAWASPVNEPSSVHATSDDNGDVEPAHLQMLLGILTDGTSILGHLGYGSNNDWDTPGDRFSQKRYTPSGQRFGYYHAWRGGRLTDKVRRRFSWMYEDPGRFKRLWVDGEGVGAPTSGAPLRYVSVTENGHEMNSPEAVSLIVAMQSVRGIGSEMSGNGVQRYQAWSNVVGFNQIPWTVRQMHRDVHTFRTIHHSGDAFRGTRVLAAQGEARIDGVIGDSGRFDYVIHGGRGSFNFRVERGFVGQICDPTPMTCQPVSAPAGGTLPVSYEFGRVFTGRVQ